MDPFFITLSEISHYFRARHQFALISSQTAFDKAFLSLEIFNRAHHTEVEFGRKNQPANVKYYSAINRYKNDSNQ
ncbi:hypothetical protein [Pantoea stewartii]|uniref:hypothetical protein n=1 Tax=Pantoea stewartii TaxID=66269 RepID=UPI0025A181C0|nr:hypothetical protein [Pantoea stewartii]